jgi:hypothetical protein
MDYGDNDVLSSDEHLENWVMAKCDSWRDHYESNYSDLKNSTVYGVESGQQRTWNAKVSVHVSSHLHYSRL